MAASDVSQVFYYDSLVSNGETTEPIFTRVTFKETASAADITALEKMGGFVIYAEGFVMQSRSFSEDYNDFEAYGIEGIPEIILFAPDGKIVARGLRGEEIEKAVKKALGK